MPVARPPSNNSEAAIRASGMTLSDIINAFGIPRYGMPTDEKERIASEGSLPGAPRSPNYARPGTHVSPADHDERSNRYASGYLFSQTYPNASRYLQPLVDEVKMSWLPWVGGASPEVQAYAERGSQRAQDDMANGTIGSMIQSPPKPPRK